MKVLNIGSLNVDHRYEVSHITKKGETQSSLKVEYFAGGKGLNQSIAMARAGLEVFHAGFIGKGGEMLYDTCVENKVDTKYLEKTEEKAGHAIIQVDKNGENCILLYGGSNLVLTKKYVDNILLDFSENDILVLQNEVNLLDYIIEKAYEKRMQIILNPSPFNEKLQKCDLSKVSYFMINEVEGEQITGKTKATEILNVMKEKYPKAKVILTLGEKGSWYKDENEEIFCDVFKTKVVDTTGAGDAFAGYFVSGVVSGLDKKDCLKLASKASSLAVAKEGAVSSIPYKKELENLA